MWIKALLMASVMWLAPKAWAAESFDHRSACDDYNRYGRNAYYYCTQDAYCAWDGFQCVQAQGPGPQQCRYYRDWRQCQQAGCYWDQRYGCIDNQQPQRCEYIRDWRQCQQAGCYWDRQFGCTSQPPSGGLWQCQANDTGWEEHRGGHVAQGRSQAEASREALRVCQVPFGVHDRCYIVGCQRVAR